MCMRLVLCAFIFRLYLSVYFWDVMEGKGSKIIWEKQFDQRLKSTLFSHFYYGLYCTWMKVMNLLIDWDNTNEKQFLNYHIFSYFFRSPLYIYYVLCTISYNAFHKSRFICILKKCLSTLTTIRFHTGQKNTYWNT